MRLFANLFLILFVADGAVSMADGLFALYFPVAELTGFRNFVAFCVVVVSISLYLIIGLDRRLPKRILLPPLIFVFWSILGLWPLSAVMGENAYTLTGAALQLVIGLAALFGVRRLNGKSLLMTDEMFAPRPFRIQYTLLFFIGNMVIIPVVLSLFAFTRINFYVHEKTGGFARLGYDGLYMLEKRYRLEGKMILLAGMIHIAEKDYYDELIGSIPAEKTVVLAEGVTDGDGLLSSRFSYKKVAELLGMISQEDVRFDRTPGGGEDTGVMDRRKEHERKPHIIRADVDIRQFNPQTIEFLNVMGEYLLGGTSLWEGLQSYGKWAEENMSDELVETIMDDILHRRNRELTRHLESALEKYESIIIPWGAIHMPGIEEAVIDRGALLEGTTERRSIDFYRILKRVLASTDGRPGSFHRRHSTFANTNNDAAPETIKSLIFPGRIFTLHFSEAGLAKNPSDRLFSDLLK
jgi:hypothetical protein